LERGKWFQGELKTQAGMVLPKAESEGLYFSERASLGRVKDPETSLPNKSPGEVSKGPIGPAQISLRSIMRG